MPPTSEENAVLDTLGAYAQQSRAQLLAANTIN